MFMVAWPWVDDECDSRIGMDGSIVKNLKR
jgi:hypothetical protein